MSQLSLNELKCSTKIRPKHVFSAKSDQNHIVQAENRKMKTATLRPKKDKNTPFSSVLISSPGRGRGRGSGCPGVRPVGTGADLLYGAHLGGGRRGVGLEVLLEAGLGSLQTGHVGKYRLEGTEGRPEGRGEGSALAIPTILGTIPTILGTTPTILATTPTILGTIHTILGTTPTILGTTPTILGTTPTILGTTPTILGTTPTILGTIPTILGTTPTS